MHNQSAAKWKKQADRLRRLEKKTKNLKKKDRDFRKLLSTDINELNPDEIKLKLNLALVILLLI